jgi:hypothetical protein
LVEARKFSLASIEALKLQAKEFQERPKQIILCSTLLGAWSLEAPKGVEAKTIVLNMF